MYDYVKYEYKYWGSSKRGRKKTDSFSVTWV